MKNLLSWHADNSSVPLTGEPLHVFVVPHTHDDTGWQQTVDEYFVNEVKWILDSVTAALGRSRSDDDPRYPKRIFSYVEMAFFERWWREQTSATKNRTRALVNMGLLEFNLAGWCMNDEAAPTYSAAIDQMTEGQQFVLREFGPGKARPRAAWHVDPFGHSAAIASLWHGMGFDVFGLNRIDWREKDRRKSTKELEFVWRGSRTLGKDSQIFAHVLDSHYGTPGEINYDGGLRINTDERLPTYGLNARQQAEAFVKMARSRSAWYRHNYLLVPFGNDFDHQNAFLSFDGMDELAKYVNANVDRYNVTVSYGGVEDYVQAVNALDIEWPVVEDAPNKTLPNGNRDFMIYATDPHNYWSGYYTSRPKLKGYSRSRETMLRSAELLATAVATATPRAASSTAISDFSSVSHGMSGIDAAKLRVDALTNITFLRRAIGVTQHHDAITGTERQHVTDDYMLMLGAATARAGDAQCQLAAALLGLEMSMPCTVDPNILSRLGAPALPAPTPRCVAWRQTGDCDASGGGRQPQFDKPCNASVACDDAGHCDSGYCECAGGERRALVGCTRNDPALFNFTCEAVCNGKGPAPLPATFNKSAVLLHNTLGWAVNYTVRLVVNTTDAVVLDSNGEPVPSQVNPLSASAVEALNVSVTGNGGLFSFNERTNALQFSAGGGSQRYALYFVAHLAPAAMTTYYVTHSSTRPSGMRATLGAPRAVTKGAPAVLDNGVLRLEFDGESGLLSRMSNARSGVAANVTQNLHQYLPASDGTDGAYSFRPVTDSKLTVGMCGPDPHTHLGCCEDPDPKKNLCKNFLRVDHDFALGLPVAAPGAPAPQPIVIAAGVGEAGFQYNDVIVVTTRNVTGNNASFNVARPAVNGLGWGQNGLNAAFLLLDASAPGAGMRRGFVAGTADVAPDVASGGDLFKVHVDLKLPAGAGEVRVLAQPRLGGGAGTAAISDNARDVAFAASIVGVSEVGADFIVQRVHEKPQTGTAARERENTAASSAPLPLQLDWIAWRAGTCDTADENGRECIEGSTMVTRQGNDTSGFSQWVTLDKATYDKVGSNSQLLSLTSVVGAGAGATAVGTLTSNLNGSNFFLSGTGIGAHIEQDAQLRVDWLIIQGETVQWPILEDPAYRAAAKQPVSLVPNLTLVEGPIMTELFQHFRDGYSQTWRLGAAGVDPDADAAAELIVELAPLDPKRELIARFDTSIPTLGTATAFGTDAPREGAVLYADANALEYERRVADVASTEPVAGNYYPLGRAAFIQDEIAARHTAVASTTAPVAQLSLIADRAHGVAALRDGEIEVMLHRRCAADDHKGVGETLDEKDYTTSQMYVSLDEAQAAARLRRTLGVRQSFAPTALFVPSQAPQGELLPATRSALLAAGTALPPNVHLLSLDQRYGPSNATVLRLQHLYEADEHATLSKPATIDIGAVFNASAGLRVLSAVEMTLSANAPKADVDAERLQWKVAGEREDQAMSAAVLGDEPLEVFCRFERCHRWRRHRAGYSSK